MVMAAPIDTNAGWKKKIAQWNIIFSWHFWAAEKLARVHLISTGLEFALV